MNKKIADRLWIVVSKIRGTFEITELCKIIIYTLFLKYIDIKKKQAEDDTILSIYDEKFSVGYLALIYGKMVTALDLVQYIARIEIELGFENTNIADELRRLLERVDTETVRIIFESVEQTEIENSEQLYELILMLFYKLTYANGRINHEGFTNLSICKLEARLLDCQEGMLVYDGFCGCGLLVNEVANSKGIVYMQDINVSNIALATVLTLIRNNKIGSIRCGDSQLNPLLNRMYDRIVCEPPFMPKYSNDYFLSVPRGNCIYQESLDSESLALRHVLAHLNDDGIAIVLVPMGMLFKSGRVGKTREKLVIDKYIDTVIELPGGLFPGTGVATALLVLKKNRTENTVYMINTKDFFKKIDKIQFMLEDKEIERIVSLYNSKESVEGIANNILIEDIIKNGFNLCTTQYVTLKPTDTIIVKDTIAYMKKYGQLANQLAKIDRQLDIVRSRFIKESW